MRTHRQPYADLERIIEFDFLRATEAAALNTLPWIGRGEKEKADAAACDAIRGMFDLVHICGEVVIGEGIKDNAPGIFKGEHLGTWTPGSHKFDLALDPIDGTTNVSKGLPGSICCLAAASPEESTEISLKDIPTFYMMKLAYGEKVVRYMQMTGIDIVSIRNPIEEIIPIVAKALRKRIRDLAVVVLDRPRHSRLVDAIRSSTAMVRMISDGDITAAIAPSMPGSGVDLYAGIGGAPEAVLAAAAIRCLGGDLQTMMWPRDEEEKKRIMDQGLTQELQRVFYASDLARGNNIIFCATGVSDSPLLRGVRVSGRTAVTHSILMRARSKTVRMIEAYHDLAHKTIHLRSTKLETPI
ncbi:MAG: class II fructose-bisphosphatase [Verrucomicrobia bacterium]|nr:class II fructose-bisphosphatase [Verrucomicrobiota bacterium]